MRIAILFHFANESEPSAVTVAEGSITDILLPQMGDTVTHTDFDGSRFRGCVIGRHFDYSLAQSTDDEEIDGTITVTLSLGPMSVH